LKLGGNSEDMRKKNRCTVLEILMKYDKISRADLVRLTGLNKATITNIINDFTQSGIVKHAGPVIASNGRKTAGISLNMREVVTLVIRINRYNISFAFCNVHGEITDFRDEMFEDDDSIERVLEILRRNTKYLLDNRKNRKVLGISIGILGWLFRHGGHIIAKTDGFPELGKADIKEEMEKMFPGYEIILEHDAKLSALAEWKEYTKNSNTTSGTMLNIIGGIGFGGGIIINGELFHGSNGVAGEVGHLGINFNAAHYGFNTHGMYRGTYEEYASPRALRNDVLNHLMDFPETSLNDRSTLKDIYEAYEQNDPLAVWAVNRSARLMAYGLTGLIFVLNPNVIVLGDKIIHSERFMAKLKHYLKEYLPAELFDNLELRMSTFNETGVLLGASVAMINYYLKSHRMIDFIEENYNG